MKAFARLLDALAFQPQRNLKIRLLADYFARGADPERGYALAALTGTLSFAHAKPSLLRGLVLDRVDEQLFGLSYDYVGDLAETISLVWPPAAEPEPVALGALVEQMTKASKAALPAFLVRTLDRLETSERYAFIKLMTGALRVGVSARLAKTALADWSGRPLAEIEEIWHAQAPPYLPLFAWLSGGGERPATEAKTRFRPVMLAHALDEAELEALNPEDFVAEWKWDGIRVQLAASGGECRLYSRTGEDISRAFPDLTAAAKFDATLDGELLVIEDGEVQSFATLQQRLNRKQVSDKMMRELPAGLMAYDILFEDEEDLRPLGFAARRARLETLTHRLRSPRFLLSPLVPFTSWDDLAKARAEAAKGALGPVEGLMLKRRDALYTPGRVKGLWHKWKRDPHLVDAVLMYAQRGHGKRSSYYSDYTFGVWRESEGVRELVPVGKAYFGFTDEELKEIDRFVRHNTVARFGPVREVVHEEGNGLVLEVAFEGLQRSTRHRSGIAMRFPRINRLRWDKPPREADTIEALEQLLARQGARTL